VIRRQQKPLPPGAIDEPNRATRAAQIADALGLRRTRNTLASKPLKLWCGVWADAWMEAEAMIRSRLARILVLFAATPAGALATSYQIEPMPLTITDLQHALGEPMDSWLAARPQPLTGQGYSPECRPLVWNPRTPLRHDAAVTTVACSYAVQLGTYHIRPPLRLQPGDFRVARVTYYFQSNHLAAVSVRAPTRAYNTVLQELSAHYGAPTRTLRRTRTTSAGPQPQVVKTGPRQPLRSPSLTRRSQNGTCGC
jgi:hypothetical protein